MASGTDGSRSGRELAGTDGDGGRDIASDPLALVEARQHLRPVPAEDAPAWFIALPSDAEG